jgi:hypothetical protein
VYGQWVVNNNAETTYFFFNNNEVPGIYPLEGALWQIKVTDPLGTAWILQNIISPNPQVNITSFGPPGGYIEGNFNVMMGPNSIPVNVICNFKVKR